jgi:molybdopterin-guanine dinucleotide biosynthesis protein A/molybdopterin-guanine dinucleotide biosynthesis protein
MRDFLRELDVVYVNAQELTDGVRKSTGCNTPQEWERLMEQESPRGGTEQVIVSVTGWSGSGKTTWLERLLPELSMRGIRTAVVKHDAHDFQVDREGKDTWRMAQAGAAVTGIVSGYKAALMEYRPVALERFIGKIENVDLVILEGGSDLDLPHILVYREALGKGMRVSPDSCLAVISDDPVGDGCDAVFSFEQIREAADHIVRYLASQRGGSIC